jgi:type I restriction enzyme M protein
MEQGSLDFGDSAKGAVAHEDAAGGPVGGGESRSLGENEIIDFITGKAIRKRKSNEEVRQQTARVLAVEYGIDVDDMQADFPIRVLADTGRWVTKKADIAIFAPGTEHTMENLRRVVICKPPPKNGRASSKVRTFNQAKDDLVALEELLGTESTPQVRYGMWTDGHDRFFLYKKSSKLGAKFESRADWPIGDESSDGVTAMSVARRRRGEREMLKTAFRRCHDYVHGNEGMAKDVAFWQFLYLLFAKMHDERVSLRTGRPPEFYALPDEPFDAAGRKAIQERILALFDEVKREYPEFKARDEITLSPRALAFIVAELAPYDLTGTDMDVKGLAYQELVGTNLRGDRGQYFTPSGAVELMVRILAPKEHEKVLDPACGTGGFLRETLRYRLDQWRDAEHTAGRPDTKEQLVAHQARLAAYADECLFGADFDPSLVRATTMSIMTFTGAEGHVYHMNSLLFPEGDYPDVARAEADIPFGTIDVLMTNPPFGSDIKIEDKDILAQYRDGVAQSWQRNKETGLVRPGGRDVGSMAPEQLFVQRAVQWVRPGGRIGIVLPNGLLSNPGPADEGIRQWILRNCWVLASIELPVETFIVEANVNILTTLLFLKKKPSYLLKARTLGRDDDYPVFMAVAEKIGKDRRGNPVYKRDADGETILEDHEELVPIRRNGVDDVRRLVRRTEAIDNDLPEIAKAYKAFREKYPEPGEEE